MDYKPKCVISISFGRSSSKNFSQAVQLASALQSFKSEEVDNKEQYSIQERLSLDDIDSWQRIRTLLKITSGWKSTRIEYNGIATSGAYQHSYQMDRVEQCYRLSLEEPYPDSYCKGNIFGQDTDQYFGCRFEKGVAQANQWTGDRHWYEFGNLIEDASCFMIHKDIIEQTMSQGCETLLCNGCPNFAWTRIEQSIHDLPDKIDLSTSEKFQLKFSEYNPDKSIGIELKGMSNHLSISLGLGSLSDNEREIERFVPDIKYSDIAGQDTAIEDIKNIVQLPLTHSEYFESVGVQPQNGVLLYGPPGNGKTLLAKAVASESRSHLEIISGPEILSKWVGDSERNLREIFERARKFQPSVILIDEIDSIAPLRSRVDHQHEISLVSQLLVLLDGIEERGKVAIIATTNRPGGIDHAIRRPGRIDYEIEVRLLDKRGRESVLELYLKRMKTDAFENIPSIAQATDGFSGADLASLCREAGLIAIRYAVENNIAADNVIVHQHEFDEAIESVMAKRFSEG